MKNHLRECTPSSKNVTLHLLACANLLARTALVAFRIDIQYVFLPHILPFVLGGVETPKMETALARYRFRIHVSRSHFSFEYSCSFEGR
jgi:hypothetical protein